MQNYVKNIYAPFTDEEVADKIAEMLKPEMIDAELQIVYQPIEGLHKACPNHKGDWYFSGDYPTSKSSFYRLLRKAIPILKQA